MLLGRVAQGDVPVCAKHAAEKSRRDIIVEIMMVDEGVVLDRQKNLLLKEIEV